MSPTLTIACNRIMSWTNHLSERLRTMCLHWSHAIQLGTTLTRYDTRTQAAAVDRPSHARLLQALLLGQKAARDFGVYSWAFQMHHFRVLRPEGGVLMLEGAQRQLGQHRVAVLLCHSIFTSNCFRHGSSPTPGAASAERVEELHDLRTFPILLRGRKLNRISCVRRVLTTKDGYCETLRASGLSDEQLHRFTFPCWSTSVHEPLLRARMRNVEQQANSTRADDETQLRRVISSRSDLKLISPHFTHSRVHGLQIGGVDCEA